MTEARCFGANTGYETTTHFYETNGTQLIPFHAPGVSHEKKRHFYLLLLDTWGGTFSMMTGPVARKEWSVSQANNCAEG